LPASRAAHDDVDQIVPGNPRQLRNQLSELAAAP
jgi:hypothetical protein